MIGMMYLVLTAMLALNVSADVLDAFTKVQQGLTSTIANFTKKNADLYNDIEMAYNLNQTKVAAVREKTNEIRKSTQELVDYIEQLKYKMVVLADGEEDADVMNIKAKDNLDIGGQVMVLQGKGKELREMITAYREQLSGLIADKDSVLKNSVLTHLATDDPKPVDGEFKSWEVSKFEGIPLVGVVTLLTMYQADILSTESDVVKYLFSSMDAESFKFNKLEALVIPESRYILKGETFKAKIMLAATDSTQKPVVIANGRNVAYQGDYAVYSEPATTAGFRKVKGVINYITPSGTSLPRDFELEYEVADPAVVISPTKMNVFYLGVDNPVALAAYAGAGISGADPMKTGFAAAKLAIAAFIVPYIFVLAPELLMIDATPFTITFACATAIIGMWGVSVAMIGFCQSKLSFLQRLLFFVGGLNMIIPGAVTDAIGVAILAVAFFWQRMNKNKGPIENHGEDL